MANKKIYDLPRASSITGNEVLPLTTQADNTAADLNFISAWFNAKPTAYNFGALSYEPTVSPFDGGPIPLGAQYYNTDTNLLRVYGSSGWFTPNIDAQLLAEPDGATLVGTPAGTVQASLDARPTSAALAADTGPSLLGFAADVSAPGIRDGLAKMRDLVSLPDYTSAEGAVSDGIGKLMPGASSLALTSALAPETGNALIGFGDASVYQGTPSTPCISHAPTNPAKVETLYFGMRFSQDQSAPIGGGTTNNHAMLKWEGGQYNRSLFNTFTAGQYGISFTFGAASLADRRHKFGQAIGNTFDDIQGMSIENIGASYSALVGNVGDAGGSVHHAIRLSGYRSAGGDSTDAECKGVVGSANAFLGTARGLAAQNASSLWNLQANYFEDCDYAVQMFTATSPGNYPQLGAVGFTASNVGRAIYGVGFGYCTFDFTAEGSASTGAFVEETADVSALGHNRYRGTIKNTATGHNATMLRYSHNVVDLIVDGAGSNGVFIAGNYNTGQVVVSNAASAGVAISGSNNLIRCVVTGSGSNAVSISGNNNVVEIVTDGNVSVTGTGNQIKGRIAGTIAKGTGNDYAGVQGFLASGDLTTTTNASGEITFTPALHASATATGISAIVQNFTTEYRVRLKSFTGGVGTLVITNPAGTAVASTSIQVRWSIQAT